MRGMDLSKHFSLASSQEVDAICHPVLESIGITYFNYLKIHHLDSSRELLTNNANWIDHFYIRNIDLLKRFILYFNDKGYSLINRAEKNRIYLPEKQLIDAGRLNSHQFSESERERFYKKTQIEKYYLLNEADDLYLTRKQAECVAYFIEGATAKQCAKALNISHRTVESYVEDVKNKISLVTGKKFTKEKLIAYLKDAAIHDAIFPDNICVAKD